MLYSVELKLRPVAQGVSFQPTGYHLYSLFLRLIEGVNPTLATALHGEGGPKPFTLSPLRHISHRQGDTASESQPTISLRLTFLQEEVFATLVDAVWRLPRDASLPLGNGQVVCQSLATIPSHSRWAAFASFQELLETAPQEHKLRLSFLSPTTFRSKGERNILFPESSLVFGSLMARWNAFAPATLSLNLGKTIAPQVRLSGYRLATRMLDFGSYQEVGFYGQATYDLDEGLTGDEVRALQALADFAFYSGVGAKTTMGMGQCRRQRLPVKGPKGLCNWGQARSIDTKQV